MAVYRKDYVVTDLPVLRETPENLISGALDNEIRTRMLCVIRTEAPVRKSLMYKRVLNSFGLLKLGSRLLSVFERVSSTLNADYSIDYNGEVVYHFGDEDFFRPSPECGIRYSYQIPYAEAGNCILWLLERNPDVDGASLKKLFTAEMGWEKTGAKVLDLFEGGLKAAGLKRR